MQAEYRSLTHIQHVQEKEYMNTLYIKTGLLSLSMSMLFVLTQLSSNPIRDLPLQSNISTRNISMCTNQEDLTKVCFVRWGAHDMKDKAPDGRLRIFWLTDGGKYKNEEDKNINKKAFLLVERFMDNDEEIAYRPVR